jgi:hypothetical protein
MRRQPRDLVHRSRDHRPPSSTPDETDDARTPPAAAMLHQPRAACGR